MRLNYTETSVDTLEGIVIPTVCIFGLIEYIACFTIFNSSKFKNNDKTKENLYWYLKVEALFIMFNFFIQSFRLVFFHPQISQTLPANIYRLYLLIFFAGVLEMSALLCRFSSAVDFYVIIANKTDNCKLIQNVSRYIKVLIIFEE